MQRNTLHIVFTGFGGTATKLTDEQANESSSFKAVETHLQKHTPLKTEDERDDRARNIFENMLALENTDDFELLEGVKELYQKASMHADTHVVIIARSTGECIQAQLMLSGMEEMDIDNIAIYDARNLKDYKGDKGGVVRDVIDGFGSDNIGSVTILDCSPTDAKNMTSAAKEKLSDNVNIQEYCKRPGKFNYDTIVSEFEERRAKANNPAPARPRAERTSAARPENLRTSQVLSKVAPNTIQQGFKIFKTGEDIARTMNTYASISKDMTKSMNSEIAAVQKSKLYTKVEKEIIINQYRILIDCAQKSGVLESAQKKEDPNEKELIRLNNLKQRIEIARNDLLYLEEKLPPKEIEAINRIMEIYLARVEEGKSSARENRQSVRGSQ